MLCGSLSYVSPAGLFASISTDSPEAQLRTPLRVVGSPIGTGLRYSPCGKLAHASAAIVPSALPFCRSADSAAVSSLFRAAEDPSGECLSDDVLVCCPQENI